MLIFCSSLPNVNIFSSTVLLWQQVCLDSTATGKNKQKTAWWETVFGSVSDLEPNKLNPKDCSLINKMYNQKNPCIHDHPCIHVGSAKYNPHVLYKKGYIETCNVHIVDQH